MLAERLEFFVPKLMRMMTLWQWLLYLFFWSFFVTIIDRYNLATGSDFLIRFSSRTLQNFLTVIPALYLIDYLRPIFKRLSVFKISLSILALLITASIVSRVSVMLIMINVGWVEYDRQSFISNIAFDSIISGSFTLVFLIYFLHRYRELNAIKQSFEYELTVQNDLIKARLAPHFFFNTINSLLSLIETNSSRASELLQHLSALFRASFSGAREISFEEEIALCEHYLAIESYRLGDRLVVKWQLPDADIMYDMVITALTLQSVIEKILINVVEMTTETIYIEVVVTWEQHRVNIKVIVQLPNKTLMVIHDLRRHVDFYIQAQRLQTYFGQSASITSTVNKTEIMTIINYPLQDAGI